MMQTSHTGHRVGRAVAVLFILGSVVAGFGTAAHAHSLISGVTVDACTGGTVERGVTVSYSTEAEFNTGVRLHVVSATPDGPIVQTKTLDIQGPTAITIPLSLAPGTYYVDWEDRSGDRVTWSGRHSGLGDYYRGIFLSTLTVVAPCAVATATTTTIPSTTTTTPGQPPTTTPGQPPITPAGPSPSTTPLTGSSTSSSVPPAPPTATAAATTTTRPPFNTLVATGGNTTPMLALGTVFVGLGAISLVFARRSPSRPS